MGVAEREGSIAAPRRVACRDSGQPVVDRRAEGWRGVRVETWSLVGCAVIRLAGAEVQGRGRVESLVVAVDHMGWWQVTSEVSEWSGRSGEESE